MKQSQLPTFLVIGLLALIVVLGGLQYVWLNQVGEGERARLQRTVENDARRFADDFNREIQNAYFTFQLDAEAWREDDYATFNERLDLWRETTGYPNLIKDFYFANAATGSRLLQYDREKRIFQEAAWTNELEKLRGRISEEKSFWRFDENLPALMLTVREVETRLDSIVVRPSKFPESLNDDDNFNFLVVVLDENTIKNQILPDLAQKYFSDGEMAEYNLRVNQKSDAKTIFQTRDQSFETADASTDLFNLAPDNFMFLANRRFSSKLSIGQSKVTTENVETIRTKPFENREKRKIINIENDKTEKPRFTVYNEQSPAPSGAWNLSVRHNNGSIGQFVTRTRYRNLAIGYGILSLLAISIVLVFVSAQRAKLLAQRQIDFVSSVSHEFRTPLAVIYSAGENLTDGVISSETQVAKYGNLIKREGKKLSAMVEQILEFAGARSGRKKYDFRETDAGNLVENALRECQSLLEEKKFTVEKEIAENLPNIKVDSNAFSQAIQNLIANSVKYASGEKWLKVSAKNGNGDLKISVEDKGIGISKKEISQIFQPFYRSKSVVDRQIHGNGLGLSLVKQTVEAHGGRVSVVSEIGKGSRFTIHLPLNNKHF